MIGREKCKRREAKVHHKVSRGSAEVREKLVFIRSALPDGLAFFEERGEAFLEVWGAPDAGALEDCALQILVNSSGRGGNEQMLGTGNAAGAGGN
jgi:hypothetical protein